MEFKQKMNAKRPESILYNNCLTCVEVVLKSKFNRTTNLQKDGLKQYLAQVNWRRDLETLDTNDGWKFFKDELSSGID